MWVLRQKISQRGGDVRREQCCSIKHKHKPQHTSAHVLLTPFEIHTQKQPPHCKETSTFQSSSLGSVLFIIKSFSLFCSREHKKTKKGATLHQLSVKATTILTRTENNGVHVLANEPKVGVGLWQKPHKLHCNSYKQSVEDDTSPPQPHMTSFTSPDLTFTQNTNNLTNTNKKGWGTKRENVARCLSHHCHHSWLVSVYQRLNLHLSHREHLWAARCAGWKQAFTLSIQL